MFEFRAYVNVFSTDFGSLISMISFTIKKGQMWTATFIWLFNSMASFIKQRSNYHKLQLPLSLEIAVCVLTKNLFQISPFWIPILLLQFSILFLLFSMLLLLFPIYFYHSQYYFHHSQCYFYHSNFNSLQTLNSHIRSKIDK